MTAISRNSVFGILLLGMLALAGCSPQDDASNESAQKSEPAANVPANDNAEAGAPFDFYVLALSWSPSFCAANKDRSGSIQCNGSRNYSFIVHGLWPQFEKGWPANCATDQRSLPKSLMDRMLSIMPGKGLIRHQWKKHGTCSGLDQQAYFKRVEQAYEKIRIPQTYSLLDQATMVSPADIESAFIEANPSLKPGAIAVTCDRRRLREVRICLSKQLKFRNCKEVDRKSCNRKRVVMPPVR